MTPDDTTPCGVPAVELDPCELEACPPTLPAPPVSRIPPEEPWSAEDAARAAIAADRPVTEADHRAAGVERGLPPPTDEPFTPGVT